MKQILDTISSPEDMKDLSVPELRTLCGEIRRKILDTVSRNGGHLAPNLGTVELSVALEKVFSGKSDRILWDVGHQSYTHKLLTGRAKEFDTLRKKDGISGFMSPAESQYDAFYSGHAGVAISEAIGLASANEALGRRDAKVVAVVGDGSLGCGISLEALNNVREHKKNFILVINDNRMAIAKSVGAVSTQLNNIITGRNYVRFKASLKIFLRRMPGGSRFIIPHIQRLEKILKGLFVNGLFFEEFGMKYVGPIDGHDLQTLIDTFSKVRDIDTHPVAVHVITEKGHGYRFAEKAPEKFHGVSAFDPMTGLPVKSLKQGDVSFSAAFGKAILDLAEKDPHTVAITAAMASGTNLSKFRERFPDRFYDVGIAEEHALVFAGGLAKGGLRPVVAMYATFLQRALDCVFHDICLQRLPVTICVDRAGAVEDGPSHHGLYDLAFLRGMPNLSIFFPRDEKALREMLFSANSNGAPVLIRYAKGSAADIVTPIPRTKFEPGRAELLREGSDCAIWAAGRECATALDAAAILERQGISAAVTDIRSLKPFDSERLANDAKGKMIFTIEDSSMTGGLADEADRVLIGIPHKGVHHFAWDDKTFLSFGNVNGLRESHGLTPSAIAEEIRLRIKR